MLVKTSGVVAEIITPLTQTVTADLVVPLTVFFFILLFICISVSSSGKLASWCYSVTCNAVLCECRLNLTLIGTLMLHRVWRLAQYTPGTPSFVLKAEAKIKTIAVIANAITGPEIANFMAVCTLIRQMERCRESNAASLASRKPT